MDERSKYDMNQSKAYVVMMTNTYGHQEENNRTISDEMIVVKRVNVHTYRYEIQRKYI